MATGITEEQLADLERCDEYSLRHYGSEVQALIDSYRKQQTWLRELTADGARWLVLNRSSAGETWLRVVPASVIRRTALAAMAHDAAKVTGETQ